VLQDAGCFLDESASVLGRCVENRVELALSDDDMHLTADPGIGEQLLDIEQSARGAVDRVLRTAVAEEGARDRDLGVLNGQRPVGVVDREGDLGPSEGGPA